MAGFKVPFLNEYRKPIAYYAVGWFLIMLLESVIPVILGAMTDAIVYDGDYNVFFKLSV
ncbi:MAG: hypothetical protein KH366_12720 [Clostridiaceae bacterium]|nr:hypothetical protein [Clostridiaceae bacterium]